MRIMLCHNYYRVRGGEDQSFEEEAWLLESRGNDVVRFTMHNDVINGSNRWTVAWHTLWNGKTHAAVRRVIRRFRPDVMHCTNTFPLISPSVYYAARAEGVPVVQALRNFRLLCLSCQCVRDGSRCDQCANRWFPWPSVLHRCYRGDRAASAAAAGMLALHRFLRTWTRMVDRYFTPTGFARRKYVEGGFPAEAIAVKPNFVHPDPGPGDGCGAYAMFAGRLSSEKGLDTLLAAWTRLDGLLPLKIVGDGPMAGKVRRAAEQHGAIQWLGRRSRHDVLTLARPAACLVFPSIGQETFGRVIIEAFAAGTPVVASRMGAMAELIDEGRTGLLFEPGDPDDLALKIRELMDHPARLARMREAARQEYEQEYTAQDNYRMLMEVYEEARAERSRRSDRRGAERRAETRKMRHSTRARDKGDTR